MHINISTDKESKMSKYSNYRFDKDYVYEKIKKWQQFNTLDKNLHDDNLELIKQKKLISKKIKLAESYSERLIENYILSGKKLSLIEQNKKYIKSQILKYNDIAKSINSNNFRIEQCQKSLTKLDCYIDSLKSLLLNLDKNSILFLTKQINKKYSQKLKFLNIQTSSTFASKSTNLEYNIFPVSVNVIATENILKRLVEFDGKITAEQVYSLQQKINPENRLDGQFVIVNDSKEISNCLVKQNLEQSSQARNLDILLSVAENEFYKKLLKKENEKQYEKTM